MRVVHYFRSALAGHSGATHVVRSWSSAMADVGLDVRVAVHAQHMRRPPPRGTEVWPVPHSTRGRFSIPLSDDWLDGRDLAVIHAGWRPANVVAALMCRRRRVPYVVAGHGVYIAPVLRRQKTVKAMWLLLAERAFLNRALAVHVYFEDEAPDLRALGVSAPLIVAPGGFVPPSRVSWDPHPDPYLLWLGRFDIEQKGLDLLVDALAGIDPAQRPRLRLHGFDLKEGRHTLERLVEAKGMQEWIDVNGPILGEEKWDLLRGARGFVYPSRFEAFGVSVLEATSLGIPTLVTRFPLGRALAARGAVLISDPDPESLAEGMVKLIGSEGARTGERSRAVIEQEFGWSTAASHWVNEVRRLTL